MCEQLKPDHPHVTGRVLFVSEDGLLGVGPRRMMFGDAVYVVAGAAVPVALRAERDGTWAIVGECCVLWIMHGEVLEGLPEGVVQDFILI
ncbi:hypothetical protein N658DRAFT_525672 [Parathielavia hyrcaniae]|uniref:Uncharacterized protein n=1 Tax=Parathielavia hyrcaniae TaxID=113614 RepID=A0AAN6PWT2_9PEZI|nr:hypothetical protein N658DRAFT_525672 [Parathielavia hyrcaniae]